MDNGLTVGERAAIDGITTNEDPRQTDRRLLIVAVAQGIGLKRSDAVAHTEPHTVVGCMHGHTTNILPADESITVDISLETALLDTPQVACYRFNGSKWSYKFYRRLLSGKYVTLPNLITDEPVIPELLMHLCTVDSIDGHLARLLKETPERKAMLDGYRRLADRLGTNVCTATAAHLITGALLRPR